jgi:hypothetical protein
VYLILVMLYTKYAGRRQNDFNVHGYRKGQAAKGAPCNSCALEQWAALKVGLGRIVALYCRSSTLFQIH